MVDDNIIEKIKKLFSLAGSSNPHEAALALEKATALMDKYKLDQAALLRAEISEVEVKSTQAVSVPKDWESALAKLVGESFGCTVMWRSGNSCYVDYWGRYVFIGPKVQLQLAEYTFVLLQRKVVKGRSEFCKHLRFNGWSRGPEMTAELEGYCKGWVGAIAPKVHKFANPRELQDTINKEVKRQSEGREVKPENRGMGRHGLQRGNKEGSEYDINRPMTNVGRGQLGNDDVR